MKPENTFTAWKTICGPSNKSYPIKHETIFTQSVDLDAFSFAANATIFRVKLFRWRFCNRICFSITLPSLKQEWKNHRWAHLSRRVWTWTRTGRRSSSYRIEMSEKDREMRRKYIEIEDTWTCAPFFWPQIIGTCACGFWTLYKHNRCICNAFVPNGLFQAYWITGTLSAPFSSTRRTKSFRDCCFTWNDFDSFGLIANSI